MTFLNLKIWVHIHQQPVMVNLMYFKNQKKQNQNNSFNKKINELRIRHKEFGLKVIKCMKFTDFSKINIDCKFYLNKNKIRDIHKKLFKNWIKINKFE